ncbi:ATP-dependent sacrificial sulfur transferase LarE [Mucisphaera calidilacus]|uniref:NH(3)-dependent NAD(+) synthetase n=1 Tax=Mucisphaera calidilacus TaxID=2527982 RepID=A0A518BV75_9BACT|nr:ATP-dependent sacrificial sulfur transferase LarE [Mucisphaera calidilacus]QDU70844.1 NH(3)-dependent NAD(+) synthetase [Mucisphaera calidilacus]
MTTAQTPKKPGVAERLAALERAIHDRGSLLVAFSGGIDSSLIAAVGRRVLGPDHCQAAIGDSLSLPRRELEAARSLAQQLEIRLTVIEPTEQNDPNYQANAGDRCFYCKSNLYEHLIPLAEQLGLAHIANGTNLDDLGDHRPGLRAAREASIVSPLVDAGLDKQDVRDIARHLGLPNHDKPASACLASRIPYGTEVTPERLAQVEQAENALADLGFTGFRVRHHDTIARIELPIDQLPQILDAELRERVSTALHDAGFTYIAIDLDGFRSGSGNILLTHNGNRLG